MKSSCQALFAGEILFINTEDLFTIMIEVHSSFQQKQAVSMSTVEHRLRGCMINEQWQGKW